MALRTTTDLAPSTRSASVGQPVEFRAKVENSGAAEESVTLAVEELKEGALGKPLAFAFEFHPPAVSVPKKGRAVVAFTWTAALPPDKPAFTFRGKLVLRRTTDGALVGTAPLELYVGSE